MQTNTIKVASLGLLAGLLLGAIISAVIVNTNVADNSAPIESQTNKPLHWVAPMDPSFIRDKPGKSPMGMDLVPVYAKDDSQSEAGSILIAPNVINNLGVRTAKVVNIIPEQTINTLGMVRYNEESLVRVHARIEGWIERLFSNSTGSTVTKGQALYSLYSPELVNAQEEYLLAMQRNNKALIKASKARLTAMQMPAEALKKLTNSKLIQQKVVFNSPQTGVIQELNIREGFYVKPNVTMMIIGALDEVWVDAEIMAKDASKIKLNQAVRMTLPFTDGQRFEGKIDYIYPSLNPLTKTLTARIRYANPNRLLKPNMFADIKIDVSNLDSDKTSKILAVPSPAVIRTGKQNKVVLAQGEGKFKSINVTLGQIFDQHIEIVSGLVEGDEVVVSAQFLIDSESSISSDFARMLPASNKQGKTNNSQSSWTHATINELNLQERTVNLTHGALQEWNMPGMTMSFRVLKHIEMQPLQESMQIQVEVIKDDTGKFVINTINIMHEESRKPDDETLNDKDNVSLHNGGNSQ